MRNIPTKILLTLYLLALVHGCTSARQVAPDLRSVAESGMDGTMYVLLQTGRLQEAADHLRELEDAARQSEEPEAISAFIQARYRYLLDGRRWQEAKAAKPVFETAEETLALVHAQTLAAAFLDEAEGAASLARVYRQAVSAMRLTRRHQVELHQIDAAVAMARGDVEETRSQMEDAVQLETPWDRAGELPVTPIPTRELFGEMLLALDEPEAAERQLAKSLETRPYRPLAVFGRALAALASGNPEDAAAHFERFVELWKDADPDLEALVTARRFLAAGDD